MIKHRIIFKGMNSCLYIYQSRFRANHATDTRLSRKTNMMLKSTENGKQNGLIKNKTILILFNTYCFFCFIKKCLFRSCDLQVRSFPSFYSRNFVVFVIYKWYSASSVKQSYIPICRWFMYLFINLRTLLTSKMF